MIDLKLKAKKLIGRNKVIIAKYYNFNYFSILLIKIFRGLYFISIDELYNIRIIYEDKTFNNIWYKTRSY